MSLEKIIYILRYKVFTKSFFLKWEIMRWILWEFGRIYLNLNKEQYLKELKHHQGEKKLLKQQSIVFVVPGTTVSGGIAIILRYANKLLKDGYDVKIFSQSNFVNTSWYKKQNVAVIPYRENYKQLKKECFDMVFATSWTTAYPVAMSRAKRKIYFVQSDESRFFINKRIKKLILDTYKLPMEYMTEAIWIQKWLKEKFKKNAYYVPNGIDLNIFKKVKPSFKKGNKLRVLIEGAIDIPYKGMEDAYGAVKDLDCELWIVSNNGKPKKSWKYDKFFESVPMDKMKNIYSSCDIFLKMSKVEGFFGPPLEAMACGCAVVAGKVSGYEEYIINERNALVVEKGDIKSAKKAVKKLLNNKKLRNKLVKNGYITAKNWSWKKSYIFLDKVILNKDPKKHYTKKYFKKD